FFEDRGDTPDGDEFDGLPKAFDGGQMREAIFWAEIGALDDLLQGARPAHDFAENRPNGTFIEGPFVGIQDVLENFLFSSGGKDFGTMIVLDFADLRRQ